MDYYQILGISRDATHEDIVKAYRQAALKHHPDRNPGNLEAAKEFKKASEAFETLSDKNKRHQYDIKTRPKRYKRSVKKKYRYKNEDFLNDPNLGNCKTPKAPTHDIWGKKLMERERQEWEKNAATEGISDQDLNTIFKKPLRKKVHNPNPPPPPPPREPKDGFFDAFENEYLDGNSPYLR